MKSRRLRFALLGAFGAALAGLVVWFAIKPTEPTYHGKPLSWWIAELKGSPDQLGSFSEENRSRFAEAKSAIKAMGLSALPSLLNSVDRHESWWENFYREFCFKVPAAIRQKLPVIPQPNGYEQQRFQSFVAEACREAVPGSLPILAQAFRNERPEVRQTAATALGGLSVARPEVLDWLTGATADRDTRVRGAAVNALGRYGPAASNAAPQIAEAMLHSAESIPNGTVFVRANAAIVLGNIGPAAAGAVPALRLTAAQKTNVYLRVESALALWKIRGEASEALPILLAEFGGYDPNMKGRLIDAFRDMGTNAKAAAPLLASFIKASAGPIAQTKQGVVNRGKAREALQRIAP